MLSLTIFFLFQIMGLPYKCKKKDIKEFFRPLVPFSIRLPYGKGKKVTGFCYVGFRTEKELKKALGKDKLFLGNFFIYLFHIGIMSATTELFLSLG